MTLSLTDSDYADYTKTCRSNKLLKSKWNKRQSENRWQTYKYNLNKPDNTQISYRISKWIG